MPCSYETYLRFFHAGRAAIEAGDARAFHALQDVVSALDGIESAAAWLARRDALAAEAPRDRVEACGILGCCQIAARRSEAESIDTTVDAQPK